MLLVYGRSICCNGYGLPGETRTKHNYFSFSLKFYFSFCFHRKTEISPEEKKKNKLFGTEIDTSVSTKSPYRNSISHRNTVVVFKTSINQNGTHPISFRHFNSLAIRLGWLVGIKYFNAKSRFLCIGVRSWHLNDVKNTVLNVPSPMRR